MTTFHVWDERTSRVGPPKYTIEADRIEFQPGFVVFRNNDYRILELLPEAFVQDLLQLPEPCPVKGPDGYECTFRHDGGKHSFETRCDHTYMPYTSDRLAAPIQCTKMTHRPWIAHSWIDELAPKERAMYEAHLAAELTRSTGA